MTALVVALLLAAADDAPPTDFDFPVSKGGTHLIGIGGVIGTSAAITALAGALVRGSPDFALPGATAAGLFTLFLGGGLAGARLVQPTPAAAWGSFWAGTAGAAVGFKLALDVRNGPLELVLGASALGYIAGSLPFLALPGAETLSWQEFWATLGTGALFCGVFTSIALVRQFVVDAFTLLAVASPLMGILASRIVFAFLQPFDPWVDDLKPPFRAQPILALTPSGASVGIAGSW